MTLNQKAEVKQLLKHHNHHAITPEILRELNESRSRGEGPTTTANCMYNLTKPTKNKQTNKQN